MYNLNDKDMENMPSFSIDHNNCHINFIVFVTNNF